MAVVDFIHPHPYSFSAVPVPAMVQEAFTEKEYMFCCNPHLELSREEIYNSDHLPHGGLNAWGTQLLADGTSNSCIFDFVVPLDPFCLGHMPGNPVVPGGFIIEGVAQGVGAGIMAIKRQETELPTDLLVMLRECSEFKFPKPAQPDIPLRAYIYLPELKKLAVSKQGYGVVTQFQDGKEIVTSRGMLAGLGLDPKRKRLVKI